MPTFPSRLPVFALDRLWTHPSRLPVFALDRLWTHPASILRELKAHNTVLARVASDQLPVATLDL